MLFLFLLQAATADQAQAPADIELNVAVSARRVTIERRGEASLEVTGGEGSIVEVEAPQANGRRRMRNVNVRVRAKARIADPHGPSVEIQAPAETAQPD